MLVSAIDGNKVTDPEKYIEKILSMSKSLPALRTEEPTGFSVPPKKRKGIVLRNGDRRSSDRRNRTFEPPQALPVTNQKERRRLNNREPHSKWNSNTHEIIIIAVEKDSSTPRKWNAGEEVVVGPWAAPEKMTMKPSAPPQFKRTVPLGKSEENDYIVSLSRSLGKKI